MMSETGNPSESAARTALAGAKKEELIEEARELHPEADPLEVEQDTPYLGDVYNCTHYGVFVQLTENWGSDICGLVHESDLPPLTSPRDYTPGDGMVVTLKERKQNGDWCFNGLVSPDVDASGLTLDDVRDVFQDVQGNVEDIHGEVDELTERVDELETDLNDDEDAVQNGADEGVEIAFDGSGVETNAPVIPHGTDGLASVIAHLDSEGYTTDSLTTESREDGDVVELNAVLEKPETGENDD